MGTHFNQALHAFRGFAIINISAIHVYAWHFYIVREKGYELSSSLGFIDALNGILLHDSTLYFTFISAILFATVLKSRGYKRFFASKFNYVFLPYALFTFIFTLYWMIADQSQTTDAGTAGVLALLSNFGINIVTGGALWIYWYIPVLLVLFLLTPLLEKLPSLRYGPLVCMVIILLPLLTSRVWPEVSWTNYIYFLGAYQLGLIVGQNYQLTLDKLQQYWPLVLGVAIGSTALFFIFQQPITFGITNLHESFWYIQKIAFAGLVLLWFEKTIKQTPQWLDLLAQYAFAIYFLHIAIIMAYFGLLDSLSFELNTDRNMIISLIISYPIVLGVCIATIFLMKKLFGKYSRSVIGA